MHILNVQVFSNRLCLEKHALDIFGRMLKSNHQRGQFPGSKLALQVPEMNGKLGIINKEPRLIFKNISKYIACVWDVEFMKILVRIFNPSVTMG
jgi:hypothetical protein